MEMMLTGKGYVDDGFHDELVQCLQKTDPNLYQSVNSQWSGIKAYAARGGNAPNDVWYPCDQDQKPDQVERMFLPGLYEIITHDLTEVFRVQLPDADLWVIAGVGAVQLRLQHRLLPPHVGALQQRVLVNAPDIRLEYDRVESCCTHTYIFVI